MLIDPDVRILDTAAAQFGVFTRAQASASGFTARMIDYRLSTGRWLEIHPRIYAIGGSPASWERSEMAACLWSRGAAAGFAAGHLFGLPGCGNPPLEVMTTPEHKVMARCGIKVHLTKRLPLEQIVKVRGIPSTSPERTIMDLCGLMDRRAAAIAMDNALHRGLSTLGSLDHCLYLTARRGRNGCGVMRKLLRKRDGTVEVPNSPLETVIFEMFADSMLPMPELQQSIYDGSGNFVARPDFVYPKEKLVIEGHSKLWHSGEQAKEMDRERERKLRALDYSIIHLNWADATTHRERTLAMIEERRLLLQPRSPEVW